MFMVGGAVMGIVWLQEPLTTRKIVCLRPASSVFLNGLRDGSVLHFE
jgi:hypothetical protein